MKISRYSQQHSRGSNGEPPTYNYRELLEQKLEHYTSHTDQVTPEINRQLPWGSNLHTPH
jgi:hypothetical protein